MIFSLLRVTKKWAFFTSADGSQLAVTRQVWSNLGRPEVMEAGVFERSFLERVGS